VVGLAGEELPVGVDAVLLDGVDPTFSFQLQVVLTANPYVPALVNGF